MILIISSLDDQSTNDVIDWLVYFGKKFVRISSENLITYQSLILTDIADVNFNVKGRNYRLSDFTKIWYRRSWIIPKLSANRLTTKDKISQQINAHLVDEMRIANSFFLSNFQGKTLNKIEDTLINKLSVLKLAKQFGLTIPNTILTSEKSELKKFKSKYKNIITKNISGGLFIYSKNKALLGYTERVNEKMISELPKLFHLTLFQEMIPKKFELRVFYLNESFYTSTIFSQDDKQTEVDFRNYNHQKPNRTPPFTLPKNIKGKLIKLMKELRMDSGSIDLIVNENNDFVFLEINPIGQFAQVSNPCNYYLEKEIAIDLTKGIESKQKIFDLASN